MSFKTLMIIICLGTIAMIGNIFLLLRANDVKVTIPSNTAIKRDICDLHRGKKTGCKINPFCTWELDMMDRWPGDPPPGYFCEPKR